MYELKSPKTIADSVDRTLGRASSTLPTKACYLLTGLGVYTAIDLMTGPLLFKLQHTGL